MARQTVIKLIDDLTGKEVKKEEDFHTVTFGIDGVTYEIDLNTRNAEKLRSALAEFVAHARKVPAKGTKVKVRRTPPSNTDRELARAARQWGMANGRKVSAHGRVPVALLEEYLKVRDADSIGVTTTEGKVVPIKAIS